MAWSRLRPVFVVPCLVAWSAVAWSADPTLDSQRPTESASPPEFASLPADSVVVTLHEGMPSHDRWLQPDESLPAESARFQVDHFLLDRLPQRFDDWGIRDAWQAPVLMRMAADVAVAPGKRRFLMRVRGLSRLWVDGQVIATSQPITRSPDGEEPITPVAEPAFAGARLAEHRQQDVFGEATIGASGTCRVVLESLIGGKTFRTDPGELCVAVQTDDGQRMVLVAAAGSDVPDVALVDDQVQGALTRLESSLQALDDRTRRHAAASQDGYWAERHAAAARWASEHPAPEVPDGAGHPIDAFLDAKLQAALAASAKAPLEDAQHFHDTVLPILRDACFRCHGDKQNGGLRLDSREAALQGGDSGAAAIVPGDVAESELVRRLRSSDPYERMPPGERGLTDQQIAIIEAWVDAGADWPAPPVAAADAAAPAVISDTAFLRRVYLDTVGVGPSADEAKRFLGDTAADKRSRLIDRLLDDQRSADHWMGYWQDVLAENPTLVNRSLNTTGPFRWFLYDALRDNKPLDRWVTELILMRGSAHEGGSAGFGIAGDNDAPFAAKAQIITSAFLGIELQCARCHDSPFHSTKQRDLFALAAMLEQKPTTVPKTSRVPAAFFEQQARESLISVTLKPDEAVDPQWPFAEVTGCADDAALASLIQDADDSRQRLAALVTSPANQRFAQVIVNRLWRRYMGAGLVEPPHDWEGQTASHPELLQWLAHQFVAHGYDVKQVARQILTSQTYQRAATGNNRTARPEVRFFVAPDRRRLTAEQIVDSLYAAAGQPMDVEEITFDPDGRRAASSRLTLGVPRRAWMFANLANERDRPSLSLPRAQAITDVMEAFGWSGARQSPRTDRETDANVLQPGMLANSTASVWLTRATDDSGLADMAVAATSPQQLVDGIFLQYLGRLPSDAERTPLADALAAGFEDRLVPAANVVEPTPAEPLPRVTWSNHLRSEATTIAMELEHRARCGPAADPRLRDAWRELYEDVVWSVINTREFVWVP